MPSGLWYLLNHGLYVGAHDRFQCVEELLNLPCFLVRKWLVVLPLVPLAQTVLQSGIQGGLLAQINPCTPRLTSGLVLSQISFSQSKVLWCE
jgi:hypothetical protein